MSFEWSNSVNLIKDGVSRFCGDDLNPIIEALDNRTLFLKNHLDHLQNSNCGLVYTDTGFDETVMAFGKGAVLAWDAVKGTYTLASAEFDTNVREDGSMTPADKSYVIGILITNIDNAGYGTILAHGWSSDEELISIVTGGMSLHESSPATGAYYLGRDGKAVRGEALDFQLPVYCFTYTGTGKLVVNPRVPEFTGHSHGKFIFDDRWVKTDDLPTAVEEVIGDSGNVFYKYEATQDSSGNLTYMLNSVVRAKALLTNDGVALNSNDWAFTKDAVYVAFDVTNSSEIILYTIAPLIGVEPLVKAVEVVGDSKLLDVTNSYGVAKLHFNDSTTERAEYTGTAVGEITNKGGVKTTPVVHALGAGAGIDITHAMDAVGNDVPGAYIIHSTDHSRNQIDMNICNLDGVLFGTDTDRVSYKFPAGVTSSMYGTFRAPHFHAGSSYAGRINLIVKGTGNSIPSGTVTATIIPMPTTSTPTVALLPNEYTVDGVSASAKEKYYLLAVDLVKGTCTSDALINCKITFDSPDKPITLVGVSLQLLAE